MNPIVHLKIWNGNQALLRDFCERNMQIFLREKVKPLNRLQRQNLKDRFKRKFTPFDANVIAAEEERTCRLQGLFEAFTWSERRHLLSLLIPFELDHNADKEDNWNTCSKKTVREVFMSCFEDASKGILHRFLRGKAMTPNGMTALEDKLEKARETVKDEIAALKAKQAKMNCILRKCYTSKNKIQKQKDFQGHEIANDIERLLGKDATKYFHDGYSTYAEPTRGYILKITETLQSSLGPEDVILDLGSGAATTLWKMCQYYG